MGRPKIARKSTWVDMTAFCDVAFLLLSFFIMATKQKPAEAVPIVMPSSVSAKKLEDNDQVMVIISKEGKVFLQLSEAPKRVELAKEVARIKGYNLSEADAKKAANVDFFGSPVGQLGTYLNLPKEQRTGEVLPGIPAKDSLTSEVKDWMTAVFNIYQGDKMQLLVKGDNATKYPAFKIVIDAFKKNDMMKFAIVTNEEAAPAGSTLAAERLAKQQGKAAAPEQ